MRLQYLIGTLVLSSQAQALDQAPPPQFVKGAETAAPAGAFTPKQDVAAAGVPVEAVLGGGDHSPWMAGSAGRAAALGGMDPVSFFETGGPAPGDSRFRAAYHGGVFFFANERHRDLFMNAPEVYAPAFGGYDPELLASGLLAPADPENWTVYDGRLFLSGSPELKTDFDKHKPEVIKAAQDKWKAVDEMFEDRFFKAHQD